jgi:hypothetical protein
MPPLPARLDVQYSRTARSPNPQWAAFPLRHCGRRRPPVSARTEAWGPDLGAPNAPASRWWASANASASSTVPGTTWSFWKEERRRQLTARSKCPGGQTGPLLGRLLVACCALAAGALATLATASAATFDDQHGYCDGPGQRQEGKEPSATATTCRAFCRHGERLRLASIALPIAPALLPHAAPGSAGRPLVDSTQAFLEYRPDSRLVPSEGLHRDEVHDVGRREVGLKQRGHRTFDHGRDGAAGLLPA